MTRRSAFATLTSTSSSMNSALSSSRCLKVILSVLESVIYAKQRPCACLNAQIIHVEAMHDMAVRVDDICD